MVKGFTLTKVYTHREGKKSKVIGKPIHFTWNEDDMVFYHDDNFYFMDVPKNGQKTLSLKKGYNARYLVKLDK